MIDAAQRARIRRLFFAEHWKVGTIATELGVHRDAVHHAIESDRFVSAGSLVRPSMLDPYKGQRATNAGLVYTIRPISETPSRTLLDSPATLRNFRAVYHDFMSTLEAKHAGVRRIDCFLAVPAPVAVICGRDLLKDVHPDLVLYELVDGEYRRAFTLK